MSFWQQHGDLISAGITLLVTVVVALTVDRAILHRVKKLAHAVAGGQLGATGETRLRLIRRIIVLIILFIGVAFALQYVTSIDKLATGLLASSAVLGLVLGMAAKAPLANAIAGVTLAVTQPIRVGDTVTWEETTGKVSDITLSYTFIDTGDGQLVIPNETLSTGSFVNHTLGSKKPAEPSGSKGPRKNNRLDGGESGCARSRS